ncbi:MAG TPA: ABC transporter permease [Polyangiales bacterium]|nr:ABC transporter permease [Polyangiales bacterium]
MKSIAYALAPTRGERALRHVSVLYILALIALPLFALLWFGLGDGFVALSEALHSKVARSAFWLTIWTSTLVAAINVVFGTATAWVLVRHRLPGRSIVSALLDLPLAIPTLVAGVMLALLYGPTSLIGQQFVEAGVPIIFARPGIVLALAFVTVPFVVRAVEPVLSELDIGEEEAAKTLGASPLQTFRTVFLPSIAPAALSAGIRSLGRAIGEFGSVVVVAGNIPLRTLSAPVFILGEIESGAPRMASAVSVVLLAVALLLHAFAHFLEHRFGARHG